MLDMVIKGEIMIKKMYLSKILCLFILNSLNSVSQVYHCYIKKRTYADELEDDNEVLEQCESLQLYHCPLSRFYTSPM